MSAAIKAEDAEFEKTVRDAQDAFWASIASSYPSICTGDFPPDATFAFTSACEDAVRCWVGCNQEQPEESEGV